MYENLENIADFSDRELKEIIEMPGEEIAIQLATAADRVRRENYGDEVYVRGLIEFTNFCKNDFHPHPVPCAPVFAAVPSESVRWNSSETKSAYPDHKATVQTP